MTCATRYSLVHNGAGARCFESPNNQHYAEPFLESSNNLMSVKTILRVQNPSTTMESLLTLKSKLQRFSFECGMEIAFALVLHCYALWLASKTRAIFSTDEKQYQYQSRLARAHFPALYVGHM